MKDRLYLFIFFIAVAIVIWVTGSFLSWNYISLLVYWIVAHIYGFVALFFLALYLKDCIKRKRQG